MAAIPSYRAEMVGLSERDRTLLRSLLQATQARTGVRWDGGAGQPAVHFIDIDGQAGAEFWQSLSEAERREAAIVVSSAPPANALRWLAKPLRSASLLAALTIVPLGPSAPAAQPTAPAAGAPRDEPAAPAGPLLLLDILDGPGYPTAQALQSPHWPDLVLGSGSRHAMRTAEVDSYVYGFAVSLEVTRIGKYAGGPLDDELRIDLDTLRWLALLYAPLAEIATRLPNPPARVRLSGLPAFGHLPHTLQHVRMAAWLMQHPATRRELAEMIGCDEDSVRRFLGACNIFGLLHDIVEAKVLPEPVVATQSEPRPVIAAQIEPKPVVAAQPEPTPVVVVQPEPKPVVAVQREPKPVVAAQPEPRPVVAAQPEPEPEPVVAAAVEPPVEATAATNEAPAPAPAAGESLSVLERLRGAREQNRARVAAAIRSVTSS